MVKLGKRRYNAKKVLLILFSYIKNYERLPNELELKMSKQNRKHYTDILKRLNIAKRLSNGVWILTNKNMTKEQVKEIIVTTKKTHVKKGDIKRGHNYMFNLRLPRFEYLHRLPFYLKKKGIIYSITQKNAIKIVHNNIIYHIFPKRCSVVLYYPTGYNFLSSSGSGCDALALGKCNSVLDEFRSYLGIDFRIKGQYKVNISRSHKEWIDNELAQKIHSKGKTIMIRGKDGRVWMITDKSFNFNNLEFIDAKESTRDLDQVMTPFFNKIRGNPYLLDELELLKDENEKLKDILTQHTDLIKKLVDRESRSINIDKFKY